MGMSSSMNFSPMSSKPMSQQSSMSTQNMQPNSMMNLNQMQNPMMQNSTMIGNQPMIMSNSNSFISPQMATQNTPMMAHSNSFSNFSNHSQGSYTIPATSTPSNHFTKICTWKEKTIVKLKFPSFFSGACFFIWKIEPT